MTDSPMKSRKIATMIKMIFSAQEEDISCDECFKHIDVYVDMLRAGDDPGKVLPQVKAHLNQCGCCNEEFQALIAILEAEVDHPDQ